MRHAVKHIHSIGGVAASSKQGPRLRDANVREPRQMSTVNMLARKMRV